MWRLPFQALTEAWTVKPYTQYEVETTRLLPFTSAAFNMVPMAGNIPKDGRLYTIDHDGRQHVVHKTRIYTDGGSSHSATSCVSNVVLQLHGFVYRRSDNAAGSCGDDPLVSQWVGAMARGILLVSRQLSCGR